MSERFSGTSKERFDETRLSNVIDTILMVNAGKTYPLPSNLTTLPDLLREVDLSGKEKIAIQSDLVTTRSYLGEPENRYNREPIYEGDGVLLGERALSWVRSVAPATVDDPYNSGDCGFKLWLFSTDRLVLHLFYQQIRTSGRLSGPGYTGSEETKVVYGTPFRRTVTINKDGVNLESEVKNVIELDGILRVEYGLSLVDGGEIHILDLDEKGSWTNAVRYSMGPHVWYPCPMDSAAYAALEREFRPMAERLGTNLSFNTRELVKTAEGKYLGSYKEPLERKPYPGEIQRGETPSIRVDVYQKPDDTIIFLKEKPIF